ncbi:hypothetical protein HNR23_004637 [Nocardiopsis mwathae]|uniref:Uncharacterized protein n=1 Tax=Nocardiopsis mwathae TaxID=1472723 RepID=A0A7W9YM41_9ACTN|nr:hypothetical protein [Nocardiopsis mwathae]MBB6174577.1 hypothetical protein [Nocardiopsis mwathae]
MTDLLLVLTGAGISLASSVTVTWLQARYNRRGEVRESTRVSTRRLTALFIAERDDPGADASGGPTSALAEAELLAMTITDRRSRERIRDLTRLLRELRLPELRELSGVRPERARRVLCDHALEVLGALYRGERLPAVPEQVQRMLSVEDEALSIHAGDLPVSTAPAAGQTAEPEAAERSAAAGDAGGAGDAAEADIPKSSVPRRPRRTTRTTRDKGASGGDA